MCTETCPCYTSGDGSERDPERIYTQDLSETSLNSHNRTRYSEAYNEQLTPFLFSSDRQTPAFDNFE